jgi:hypothetical protein
MQAYLFQKDHNLDASEILIKLSSEMIAFMDLFSEMTEEEVQQFDKVEIQFVSNEVGETSELEIVPAYGTEEYYKQKDDINSGDQPTTISSIREIAKAMADNSKKLLRSTNILVSKGGDKVLTLSTNKET